MRTSVTILLAVCLLISLLSGCGTRETGVDTGDDQDDGTQANPFDYQGPPEVLGAVQHQGEWSGVLEGAPLEYTGGEAEMPYSAECSGSGKNMGFVLFVDGIPQPYRLNGQGEYAYMHPFALKEDDVREYFTFNFVPVTGKAGDTLSLVTMDMFNAGFEPDMVNSSNFGLYGGAVTAHYEIHLSAEPERDAQLPGPLRAISNVSVTSELMTDGFVDRYLAADVGMSVDGESREDTLEENVYMFDTYDGNTELNDLEVTGKDTLRIAVDMCGIPGLTYRLYVFADHVPLTDGEDQVWELTLEKGKVARLEADLDLRALPEAVTTFYFTAVLVENDFDAETSIYDFMKTGSLPIWDADRLDAGASQSGADQAGGTSAGTVEDTPEAMDETVRSLWYGQGDTVLVRKSDKLCLVDMKSGQVLAEGPVPDLKSVTVHPVDGGFCVVGETEGGGGAAALTEAGTGEIDTVCVFLDSALSETDRFSLSALAGEDRNIMCTAVSPDGRYAAFSVMNDGIYLYARDNDKVTLLRDLTNEHREENGGVTMATGLWFNGDSSKLIFADNSHFGSVGLDGEGFVCAGLDDFDPQGPVGYAGGKLLFNENFFTASGAMAVADVDDLTHVIYNHSAREGSGDLYISRDGGYFATTAFENGGITLRIYGTADDGKVLEYAFTDDNEDVFNSFGVVIFDDLKKCVVKLGGYSDVPARVVTLSFE